MLIDITPSGGIAPRINPRSLPATGAQIALNSRMDMGDLRPWDGPQAAGVAVPGAKTIYRFGQAVADDTLYWLQFLADVSVVRGPIAGDTVETTYITGLDVPRFTTSDAAISAAPYPTSTYKLGVPKPAAAPTLATSGTAAGDTTETRAYVYTNVSTIGNLAQESAPSAAALITVTGQNVALTLDSVPSGYLTTARRIYRTTGTTGKYYFVAEVPAATLSFTDTVPAAGLQEELPSEGWLMPPAALRGLTALPNGIMAGFVGRDLWFCEAFRPYAWPSKYALATDYPVVGLGVYGQSLVVGTTGYPYIVSGTDPASMSMQRLDFPQACMSRRSVVGIPGGVAYACPDGIAVIGENTLRVITAEQFTAAQWQAAYFPASIHAYLYDSKYIGFYDSGKGQSGGFVLDLATGQFSPLGFYADAGYADLTTDTLYLAVGGEIHRWAKGAALTFTWRSKVFQTPRPMNFGMAQVEATGYPVQFSLIADGVTVHTQAVTGRDPFRLPSGYRADSVEVELSSATARVTRVRLGHGADEVQND